MYENDNIDFNEETESNSKQEWLTTYADMMTLLFAFFVLLYSMSSPDPVKMSQIEDAMKKEAGFDGTLKSISEVQSEFQEIVEELNIEKTNNNIRAVINIVTIWAITINDKGPKFLEVQ